ncbi:MAG TPA: ferredoxin [Pyrinomonadaceae bacterium]|nr:ferredoxin [Pyrinomonadaceae bacterium]
MDELKNMNNKSPVTKHERTPLNAEGDFYVERDTCLICMAPEHEAPELMGYDEETGCYFKRQPKTPEELDHAIEAVCVSCVAALRYAGDDPVILERLRAKGSDAQCDKLSPEGSI